MLRGRQLGEDVRGEVRREENLGEDPLGLLHEPSGVLLRHAQRGVARACLRLDDGAQLRWGEARDAGADAVGGHPRGRSLAARDSREGLGFRLQGVRYAKK